MTSLQITAGQKGVESLGRQDSVADDESAGLVNSSREEKETVSKV